MQFKDVNSSIPQKSRRASTSLLPAHPGDFTQRDIYVHERPVSPRSVELPLLLLLLLPWRSTSRRCTSGTPGHAPRSGRVFFCTQRFIRVSPMEFCSASASFRTLRPFGESAPRSRARCCFGVRASTVGVKLHRAERSEMMFSPRKFVLQFCQTFLRIFEPFD